MFKIVKVAFETPESSTPRSKWIISIENGEGSSSITVLPNKEPELSAWTSWTPCSISCVDSTEKPGTNSL